MIASMEIAVRDNLRINIEKNRRRMEVKSIVFWISITIENV